MALAPAQLPEPSSLPEEAQGWITIYGPVSQPTADHGDWRIWPHMQGKEHWIKMMGARAGLVANFLEARNIGMDGCMICKEFGRGTQSNFEGHVGGLWHFKHWCRLCGRDEAKDMSVFREQWWECWQVHAGAIRFNHADGVVQMCRGQPPATAAILGPAGPVPMMAVGAPGAPPNGVPRPAAVPSPGGMDIMQMALQNPRGLFELCVEENQFYILQPHVGNPITPKGDLNACHWLSTKNQWKPAMKNSVEIVEKILHAFDVWPECMLCPKGVGFAEHVPAEKHLRALWEKLPTGKPVVECAKELWQEWTLPVGMIRINHVHGQVWIGRGRTPKAPPKNLPLPQVAAPTQAPQAQPPMQMPAQTPTPAMPGPGLPQNHGLGFPASGATYAPSEAPTLAGPNFAANQSDPPSMPPGPLGPAGPVGPTGPVGPQGHFGAAPQPQNPSGPAGPMPHMEPGSMSATGPSMAPVTSMATSMAPSGVEDPRQLPQEGVWYVIYPPCSEPTQANGDYKAYPHLGGKSQFKQSMTPRAGILVKILAAQPTPIDPQCTLCERHRGYEEHLGADKHWRALYPEYTGEQKIIEQTKEMCWNKTKIIGGYVRLNELTGEIQMAKGNQEPGTAPPAVSQAPPFTNGCNGCGQGNMTPQMPMQPAGCAGAGCGGWSNGMSGPGHMGPPGPIPGQGPPAPGHPGYPNLTGPTGPPGPGLPGQSPTGWYPNGEPPSFGPPLQSMPGQGRPPDSLSMQNFTGRHSDIASRASDVGSTMSSQNKAQMALTFAQRLYKSKAKYVEETLQKHQIPSSQLKCSICRVSFEPNEIRKHFTGLSHWSCLTQRMTEEDAEEDDEMILCGPKQQVRLNLWDLTIEVEELSTPHGNPVGPGPGISPGCPDGSTGGQPQQGFGAPESTDFTHC